MESVLEVVPNLEVGTYAYWGLITLAIIDPTPPNTVRTSAAPTLTIPAGARIEDAPFRVTVDPPGRALIGDIADVRPNSGTATSSNSFTVDFAGLRTVNAFELATTTQVKTLTAWMGTAFSPFPVYQALTAVYPMSAPSLLFTEVMTERLKVDLHTNVTVDNIRDGEVVIPTPPQSVEILVNGARAWFSGIDATTPSTLPDDSDAHSLAVEVDLRTALQAAVDADGAVTVELRSSAPCQMTIGSPGLRFLRTHAVRFPDGPSRTINASTEGIHVLDLPLDGSALADNWQVRAVELRAVADLAPPRVQPANGPTLAGDIELVLSGERTLLARLTHDRLDRYDTISSLRLPLRAATGGAELVAELLAHDTAVDGPGAPVSAVFQPLTVAATTTFEYATIALAAPYAPEDGVDLWLSLRAARGELAWALGDAPQGSLLDASEVRWKAPSGVARSLSTVAEVAGLRGPMRIVGEAGANQPIAAVDLSVAGTDALASITPIPAGVPVLLALPPGASVSPNDQGVAGSVRIELLVAAPGSYTFDSAVVVYRDPALDGGLP